MLRLLQDGQPPLNVERVLTVLNIALHESRIKAMGQWNIPVMTRPGITRMVPYFTAKLDETYVTFETQYETSGATVGGTEYVAPRVVFSGSFTWFDETGQLTDLEVESEKLRGADGSTIKEHRVAFLKARMSLGRGKVVFNRRGRLVPDDNKEPAG
ncbi:MAG: hypothetical protein L0Z53_19475 [Acidobacteriales bacterium]|nr:hypothetical protein [Terriglobales bacterium]